MDRQEKHNRVIAAIFALGGLVCLLFTGRVEFVIAGGVLGAAFLLPDLLKGRDNGGD